MLTRSLVDLEALEPTSPDIAAKIKTVSDRAALFRIAANAMISVSLITVRLNIKVCRLF